MQRLASNVISSNSTTTTNNGTPLSPSQQQQPAIQRKRRVAVGRSTVNGKRSGIFGSSSSKSSTLSVYAMLVLLVVSVIVLLLVLSWILFNTFFTGTSSSDTMAKGVDTALLRGSGGGGGKTLAEVKQQKESVRSLFIENFNQGKSKPEYPFRRAAQRTYRARKCRLRR